jgi:hypothetical protein
MRELTIPIDGKDSTLKEDLKKLIVAHCTNCEKYPDCDAAHIFVEKGEIPEFGEACTRVNDTLTAISY